MAEKKAKSSRKRALLILLAAAALIFLFIMGRALFMPGTEFDLSTLEGRQAYLNSLGWEIDPESEAFRTVVVPDKLEGIMAQYNRMQQANGYDLSLHLGESCSQYSYDLKNYSDSEGGVIVTLYIQDGQLIAADIHSTAVNGFMHGLKAKEEK